MDMRNDTKKNTPRRLSRGRLCPLLLLLLFASFAAGRSLFVHVHLTPAGITVAHSHPYAGHHGHSAKAFEAIDMMASAVLDLPAGGSPDMSAPVGPSATLSAAPIPAAPAADAAAGPSLRAPPAELTRTLSI